MSCKRWWRGDEDLTGTPGRDSLFGGRGGNVIDGRGGNDFIWAAWGNDTVFGGDGDDLIFAGAGNDAVEGGAGDDRVFARGGDNEVGGGAGDDRIHLGHGRDEVDAGAGDDKVYVGGGDDVVVHDVSENLTSKDYYHGGYGDDMIVIRMSNEQYNSAPVQADLAALDAWLAKNGGHCSGHPFSFQAFDLTIKNFERYEIQLTDDAPQPVPRQTPPQAVDDAVLIATGVVPITEVESNDPNGLSLSSVAQVIERSSFRVAPSDDVGDDALPRVSIEGSISHSSDPSQIPEPNANDVDIYAITLRAGETLVLDIDYGYDLMQRKSLVTQLFVQDDAGNVLADNFQAPVTDGGGGSVSVFDAYLEFTDPGTGGTYYVAVSSFDNDPSATTSGDFTDSGMTTGDYVLNVSIANPAPDLGALVISAQTLLANDSDADGDALTITGVGNAVNGTVELSSSGDVLFRPSDADFPGAFEYTIDDGRGGVATARVTVNGNLVEGSEGGDVLVGTPEADLFIGGNGGDTFNFATGSGADAIADFTPGSDFIAITDGMTVADIQESSNGDTLVSFDTGDSVLLVGVSGVPDPDTDLFV